MRIALLFLLALTAPVQAHDFFCPEPDVPFTIEKHDYFLVIHLTHRRAFCEALGNDKFDCFERVIGDDGGTHYTIEAKLTENGALWFKHQDEQEARVFESCVK